MKTHLLLFMMFCICFTVAAQDSLSVGLFIGPSFKTNADEVDMDYNAQTMGKTQKHAFSYGFSAQWFPIWMNKKGKKNALNLSLLVSKKKIEAHFDGSNTSVLGNGIVTVDNTFEYTQQRRAIFVGYKRFEPIYARFSLVSGVDIGFMSHHKSTHTNLTIEKKLSSNEELGKISSTKEFPQGYSVGLLFSIALEYKLSKSFNIGLSVSTGTFYTHTFGNMVSTSFVKFQNNDQFENKTVTYSNSDSYSISPINPFLFVRYAIGG